MPPHVEATPMDPSASAFPADPAPLCSCCSCQQDESACDRDFLYLFRPNDGRPLRFTAAFSDGSTSKEVERQYFGNTRYLCGFLKPGLHNRTLEFEMDKICRNHHRGQCAKGKDCRFLHVCKQKLVTLVPRPEELHHLFLGRGGKQHHHLVSPQPCSLLPCGMLFDEHAFQQFHAAGFSPLPLPPQPLFVPPHPTNSTPPPSPSPSPSFSSLSSLPSPPPSPPAAGTAAFQARRSQESRSPPVPVLPVGATLAATNSTPIVAPCTSSYPKPLDARAPSLLDPRPSLMADFDNALEGLHRFASTMTPLPAVVSVVA